MIKYCVYFEKRNHKIVDFFPNDITGDMKNNIIKVWDQPIMRKILILVSEEGSISAPSIKDRIGHSTSTLHENVKRLADIGLLHTEMIYKEKKQKVITPKVLFVTKNPKFKTRLKKFFQGIWVNSNNTQKVLKFLKENPKKFFSPDEISLKTKIPVDDVVILLNNWESFMTRGFYNIGKEVPFESKTMYRYKKTTTTFE